jgi:hypothetical protein
MEYLEAVVMSQAPLPIEDDQTLRLPPSMWTMAETPLLDPLPIVFHEEKKKPTTKRKAVVPPKDDDEDGACKVKGCDKTFSTDELSLQHARLHDQTKRPYVCPRSDCPKCFTQTQAVKRHVRNCHEGIRNFSCDHPGCGRRFSQRSHKESHEKTHLRLPVVACLICKNPLPDPSTIDQHYLMHVVLGELAPLPQTLAPPRLPVIVHDAEEIEEDLDDAQKDDDHKDKDWTKASEREPVKKRQKTRR